MTDNPLKSAIAHLTDQIELVQSFLRQAERHEEKLRSDLLGAVLDVQTAKDKLESYRVGLKVLEAAVPPRETRVEPMLPEFIGAFPTKESTQ